MKKEEILSNLCYHDKRNPDYDPGMDHLDKRCQSKKISRARDKLFMVELNLAEILNYQMKTAEEILQEEKWYAVTSGDEYEICQFCLMNSLKYT